MSSKSTLLTLLLTFWIICSSNETNDGQVRIVKKNTEANFVAIVLCTNNHYYCTGVLVAEKWVLTAAHCLFDVAGKQTENDNSIFIVAGTKSLAKASLDIKSDQAQIRKSKTIFIHENYTWEENFVNDIALIEMTEEFKMTNRVAVAVLNTSKSEVDGLKEKDIRIEEEDDDHIGMENFCCQTYGFGRISPEGSPTIKHQQHFVNKHCHCLEKIRSYKSPFNILRPINNFVCGRSDRVEGNLCSGDNGGPIMCANMLRGIATTVFHYTDLDTCYEPHSENAEPEGCRTTNSLDVFTDLCYHTEWLNSIVPSYPVFIENC